MVSVQIFYSMKNFIIPLLQCPSCGAQFQNTAQCTRGHIFSYFNEALDLLVHPSEEIIREIEGTHTRIRACQNIPAYVFISEKEILENNLILKDIQSYIDSDDKGSGAVILEAGCGFGYLSTQLAKAYPSHSVIASDIVSFAIKEYRHPAENLFFATFSMESIPLAPCSIDYIIVKSALHHTSHLQGVFQEFYRILKPGGTLFVFNEINVAFCERAHHAQAHDHGCNDQSYSLADYKKAAHYSAFSFSLKEPRMFSAFFERSFLSFPKRGTIKKVKAKVLLFVQKSRVMKYFIHALYPLLVYFFLVPSFFICKKSIHEDIFL